MTRTWIGSQTGIVLIILSSLLLALGIGVLIAFASSTELPLLGTKSGLFALLVVPALVGGAILFVRGELGFAMLVTGATVVIAHTGLQLALGDLTTSALEVLIALGAFVLVLRPLVSSDPPQWVSLVIDRPLVFFALLGIPGLLIAVGRAIAPVNVVMELKGYFLYPLLAYIMVAWLRDERRLTWIAWLGVAAALTVAFSGISSWINGDVAELINSDGVYVERVAGSFGTINQYGFYLSSMALVALGLVLGTRRSEGKLAAGLAVVIMVFAMSLSGSRGAWVGLLGGGIVLILARPGRIIYWIPLLALVAVLFLWQLPSIEARVAYQSSSDIDRANFFQTGIEAFKQYPILGAGWGANFWLTPEGLLAPSDGLPWLHNDYLNVLMQVGLIGLAPFVWMWWRVLRAAVVWLRAHADAERAGLMGGLLAGLIAILLEATTDHVFWRPDIAGQVWWLTGMLLAGTLAPVVLANATNHWSATGTRAAAPARSLMQEGAHTWADGLADEHLQRRHETPGDS